MATRKWRMREHFRGPVIFGSAGSPIDSTWYGDTASAVMKFDASEDELYFDGIDLWLKDDDQLEFGDVSDVVVDWDNTNTRLLFSVTGGNLEVIRNSTSGATDEAVVYINQDNASDDQAALKLGQDAAVAALDVNGAVDVDILSAYNSGVGMSVTRNLTSGNTDDVLVLFEQTNASDDKAALKVTQAATATAGVDIDCGVDIDSTHTAAALDVNRNLTSGVTTTAVVYITQDNSGDDQPALQIKQDATSSLALDANGWCDIGYEAAASPTGTPPAGSVKTLYANSKFWLVIAADAAGTFKYVQLSATSTA